MGYELKVIARVYDDFPTKFGIPRQSGIVEAAKGRVVFEPEYGAAEAFRGLDGFSHIWLLWGFSENEDAAWSPTVRPPRLGGNTRMGVYASRSPFRPNAIGMSVVRLDSIETTASSVVLHVSGVDMLSGTPVYDVKPYIPYSDAIPEASAGYVAGSKDACLDLVFPEELLSKIAPDKREALLGVLRIDPRPAYQKDPDRVYGLDFALWNLKFTVEDNTLTVLSVEEL